MRFGSNIWEKFNCYGLILNHYINPNRSKHRQMHFLTGRDLNVIKVDIH